MYVFRDNTIVPVNLKDVMAIGCIIDDRIDDIEHIISAAYDTTIHELDVFYNDSQAKIMTCFLLHDLLDYSIPSIAVKYKINSFFLKTKIKDVYLKCMQDEVFFGFVQELRNTFFNLKSTVCQE